MINIEKYFKFTENNAMNWTHKLVKDVLESLVHTIEDSIIDWEPGDEEWARLLVGTEVVAIVCAKIPLIIALENYTGQISTCFLKQEIKILVIRDFEEDQFCIDKVLLEEVFGRKMTPNISYNAFSINDLWWATVA
ncbi:hypothetical protein [Roseofilum sp. Guam]|uniref:hypothetical protein n=1 Tax=Roseofilum sp. Guam TaxID=2821502 RepID=UPI001B1135F0|nr:hypothetical protein [Roseofilum sp. Guam]MBP0030867.1 hypothetical protein [Roseofilum sp. Guam]